MERQQVFYDRYVNMTRAQILAREREPAAEVSESVRAAVKAWIQHHSPGTAKMMITLRKDGRPSARPVSAFVEGWTVGTISQKEHLKNTHVRNNPQVGYLWTELNPSGDQWLKTVWLQGACEVVEDMDAILAFYKRREAVTGRGDTHANDDWVRYLLRTTPTFIRAEGFLDRDTPAIFRTFDD
jgi:general stress protein 26